MLGVGGEVRNVPEPTGPTPDAKPTALLPQGPHSLLGAHEVPGGHAQRRHDAAKQQDQQDEGRRLLILGEEPLGQGHRDCGQRRSRPHKMGGLPASGPRKALPRLS